MNGRAHAALCDRGARWTCAALALCAFGAACPPRVDLCDDATLVVETEPCGDPCIVDFGEVTIGLQDNRRVHVETSCESGGADIFLEDSDGNTFAITQLSTFPQAVARVAFTPTAERDYAGSISITVFAPDGENLFFVDLRGAGAPP